MRGLAQMARASAPAVAAAAALAVAASGAQAAFPGANGPLFIHRGPERLLWAPGHKLRSLGRPNSKLGFATVVFPSGNALLGESRSKLFVSTLGGADLRS